jgi:hypothetical protein
MRLTILLSTLTIATGVLAGNCSYGTWRPNTYPDGTCSWDYCPQSGWWELNKVNCGSKGCATTYRGSCKE